MLASDSDDAADANVGSHSLQPQLPPTAGRAPPRDDEVRRPPLPAAAACRDGAAGPRGGGRLRGLVFKDSGGDARGNCASVSGQRTAAQDLRQWARTVRWKEELDWLVQILYSVFVDVAVSACVCVCVCVCVCQVVRGVFVLLCMLQSLSSISSRFAHVRFVFLIEVKRVVAPMEEHREALGTPPRPLRTASLFTGLHSEGITWQVKSTHIIVCVSHAARFVVHF